MRTLYFDTVLHSSAALEYLLATVGAERVVMGSDYPFEMADSDPVATVRSCAGANTKHAAMILSDNFHTLLSHHGMSAGFSSSATGRRE